MSLYFANDNRLDFVSEARGLVTHWRSHRHGFGVGYRDRRIQAGNAGFTGRATKCSLGIFNMATTVGVLREILLFT